MVAGITMTPLKTLFDGLVFIDLGTWYLIRRTKAESWR